MPLIVDGNNLLHRLAADRRSRAEVRAEALELCRRERVTIVVVFDGPPPDGAPTIEHLGRLTVEYSGAATADDVIVARLPSGSAARAWSVVTDDGGLASRVRQQGASVRPLSAWRVKQTAPRRRRPGPPESTLSAKEVRRWEDFFQRPDEGDEADRPQRVTPPKKRR